MGAYAPLPWAPADLAGQAMDRVIQPAVDTMARRGTPYRGLLYAGLALTSAGPKVIEFNARFGDPETQVVLDRLASPLGPLLHAAATGDLAGVARPQWRPGTAVVVVIAAEGYPEAPVKGDTIILAERSVAGEAGTARAGAGSAHARGPAGPDAYVLHAGTARDAAGELVSAGGRVLNVVGSGADAGAARAAAYELAGTVAMRGGWYRRDIAAGR
jgi:phosphoribosylamine--glycine ligase